jgi:hypothetical protein
LHTGRPRAAKWFEKHLFEFYREAALEIQKCGGLVRPHGTRPVNHLIREPPGHSEPEGIGGRNHFLHQFPHQPQPRQIAEQFVRC